MKTLAQEITNLLVNSKEKLKIEDSIRDNSQSLINKIEKDINPLKLVKRSIKRTLREKEIRTIKESTVYHFVKVLKSLFSNNI